MTYVSHQCSNQTAKPTFLVLSFTPAQASYPSSCSSRSLWKGIKILCSKIRNLHGMMEQLWMTGLHSL
jgi:hypothetical protein